MIGDTLVTSHLLSNCSKFLLHRRETKRSVAVGHWLFVGEIFRSRRIISTLLLKKKIAAGPLALRWMNYARRVCVVVGEAAVHYRLWNGRRRVLPMSVFQEAPRPSTLHAFWLFRWRQWRRDSGGYSTPLTKFLAIKKMSKNLYLVGMQKLGLKPRFWKN